MFTEKLIQSLKPKQTRYEVREKSGDGFAIRVSTLGERSWVFFYTFESRKRRMTFGNYPEMSLADAKKKHRSAMTLLENGTDPGEEKKQKQFEAREADTVEKLIGLYIELHAKPKKRSWKEDQRILHKDVLPIWGKRKAKDIGKRDVIELLDKIMLRGAPISANRTFSCIRKMFKFARKRSLIISSPCDDVDAPGQENERDRFLSEEEIKTFWSALPNTPMTESIRLALKLLLVTAQRKGEVIGAEWNEIDFSTNTWVIPKSKAKNKREHHVPLSSFALEVLEEIKKINGGSRWLFPSDELPDSAIRPRSVDRALRRSMRLFPEMEKFCPHDCRRTATTHMAKLRISPDILSRILNHVKAGVTEKHYNQYSYDHEKRAALEAWARRLQQIINGRTESNIIDIKTAGNAI